MRRKDIYFALGIGFISGVIGWRLALFLDVPRVVDISYAWLLVILPLKWLLVVRIGLLLKPLAVWFVPLSRFGTIGASNALIDYGYLNIWIAHTGIVNGLGFATIKAAAFIVANIWSYMLNKYWTYESNSQESVEYMRFLMVSIVAIVVNVGVASFFVEAIAPWFELSTTAWATVAAMAGSIGALIVNFVGYTLLVFKKH